MTIRLTPKIQGSFSQIIPGGLQAQLEKTGRLPPVTIQITPIDGSSPFLLDRFLSYQFSQSVLVPVDSFSFAFVAPDDETPFNQIAQSGDIVTLYANGVALSRGIIDSTDVSVDHDFGEKVGITGRNLMSQLADQDAVSITSDPIWGNSVTIDQFVGQLIANTRIQGIRKQNATTKPYLAATSPGEKKLSALQRFLEPLNLLSWLDENGMIVIGKPNMSQGDSGHLILSKKQRRSNVLSMKCIRAEAMIPNVILPVWQGQESVQSRIGKEQIFNNAASGPARCRRNGHVLQRTIVVSTPSGASPQDLSDVNRLKVASGNLLQSYAKRELARENQHETIVQVVVPGHYNERGEKYHIDHVYRITFDRGDIEGRLMYLFQVEYSLDEEKGQQTSLYFCNLGTLVADIPAP